MFHTNTPRAFLPQLHKLLFIPQNPPPPCPPLHPRPAHGASGAYVDAFAHSAQPMRVRVSLTGLGDPRLLLPCLEPASVRPALGTPQVQTSPPTQSRPASPSAPHPGSRSSPGVLRDRKPWAASPLASAHPGPCALGLPLLTGRMQLPRDPQHFPSQSSHGRRPPSPPLSPKQRPRNACHQGQRLQSGASTATSVQSLPTHGPTRPSGPNTSTEHGGFGTELPGHHRPLGMSWGGSARPWTHSGLKAWYTAGPQTMPPYSSINRTGWAQLLAPQGCPPRSQGGMQATSSCPQGLSGQRRSLEADLCLDKTAAGGGLTDSPCPGVTRPPPG